MSEWIKVSERLPEDCTEVNVAFKYADLNSNKIKYHSTCAYYISGGEFLPPYKLKINFIFSITPWQPLPEPPEDE